MNRTHLLLTTVPLFLVQPAFAETAQESAAPAAKKNDDMITTGVARGRDRLNSATSTSAIKEEDIQTMGVRSLGEIFRSIPGIRAEVGTGETATNVTVRGMPLASTGAKYLQIQEDGLPVLEYGDMVYATADAFLRADLNIAQVQAIRGGSASTFASNSPGGVINLISKTGEEEGGSVMLTTGLDYRDKRADFEYGGKLGEGWRFHLGGFYRQGEGPRSAGYDAQKGGQFKFNITKEFAGGYVRFYGKYLDDRTPLYYPLPIQINGTNGDPSYVNVPGFKIQNDNLASPYLASGTVIDASTNNVITQNLRDGQRSLSKSFGVEAQFTVSDWIITDRFRYSANSGSSSAFVPITVDTPANIAALYAGPGGTARYANGANAGQLVTSGVVSGSLLTVNDLNSVNNVTNDIRASRVWNVGEGELTTTAGFYKSLQTLDTDWQNSSLFTSLSGDGKSTLVDLYDADGNAITQNGYIGYISNLYGECCQQLYRVDYDTNAAFGSVNYQIGKLAIGASVRYDFGRASGSLYGAALGGGRVGTVPQDVDGDGTIEGVENTAAFVPLNQPAPVDYDWHYWSYSASVNYRIAEPLAVFARYSKGARTNADRLLFTPVVSPVTGGLTTPDTLLDFVKQAEIGVKYRQDGLTLNLTGFWANTQEHNFFFGEIIDRTYRTLGLEFEGAYRYGPFSLAVGATYTKAEITKDNNDATLEGKVPQRQPDFFFTAVPQYDSKLFSVGAHIYGITNSYARDQNVLKMPGYVTVSPFIQVRPAERVTVSLNANNVFNVLGLTYVDAPAIPANSYTTAQAINGRTVSLSVRFDF